MIFRENIQCDRYSPSYELCLIALLRDDKVRSAFKNHLSPSLIVEDLSRIVYSVLIETDCSDLSLIQIMLRKRITNPNIVNYIISVLESIQVPIQDQAAYEKAIGLLGDYVKLRKILSEVSSIASQGLDSVTLSKSSKESFERLKEAFSYTVPTRNGNNLYKFSNRDDYEKAKASAHILGKPLRSNYVIIRSSCHTLEYLPGTVTMVCAPPGVGKSTFCVSEGVNFAKQGARVLHYILGDLTALDVLHKYIANFVKKPIQHVMDNTDFYWNNPKMQEIFSRVDFRVEPTFSMDVDDIYADAERLNRKGNYSAIIIDYDGNIRPSSQDSLYAEGGYSYGRLNMLARDTKTAVLVGCQPKITYWNEDYIPLTAASESSRKQHHIDMMVTLSQPSKSVPLGILHLPKVRRGESGASAYVLYLTQCAMIVEITVTDYKKIKKWYESEENAQELLKTFVREVYNIML